MFGLLHRKLEPPAEAYRSGTPWRMRGRTPLDRARLVVLDTETTGFRIGQDRMLTLACVDVSGGQIHVNRLRSWLLFQPAACINDAVAVHGILPSESAEGSPEKEVLTELFPIITGAVLVGHHVSFDASVLDHALRIHFGTGLRNPMIDTARLAMAELEAFRRTAYPNQRPPSLDEVCMNLGMPMHDRHTAAGDAFTTAQLFLLLAARARRRLGRELKLSDFPVKRL